MPCLALPERSLSSRKRRRAVKLDDTIRPKWALIRFKDLPQEPAEILPVDRLYTESNERAVCSSVAKGDTCFVTYETVGKSGGKEGRDLSCGNNAAHNCELLPAAVEQDLPRAQEPSQLIPATVEHEPRSPTIEPLSPSPATSISRTHWSPMTSTPTTPFSQVIDPLHNYELMKRVMEDALAPYKQDLEKVKEKTKCYKRELEEVKEEMKSYKRELEEVKEELKCSKRRKRNKPGPGMYQIVFIY
ncbi:uncharacterized protein LOC134826732 [Bolinopsis microptera]|uniref:uncharacterized protein LOC134826732 n=1 Tax=Bolinopsis microptera TaxID=2820187 RepID=UPI00307A0776